MASGAYNGLMRFLRRVAAPRAGYEQNDEELLGRFIASEDESAFTGLVQRHGPMVFGVCHGILNDPADADDAFQATFLVLVRKASSIATRGSLPSWLHGVALRISLKARASAARRRTQERQAPKMSAVEADKDALWRDLRPVLHEEVDRLPERYRKPFVLCYLEGKTNDEAAVILGWPKGTVLSSLSRARERLRERLTRRGIALSAAALATYLAEQAAPAAIPTALVQATVKSALFFATGGAAATASIAPSVLSHTQAMLHTLALGRIRVASIALVVFASLGAGSVLVVHHTKQADLPSANPVAREVVAGNETPKPVAPVEDAPKPDRELLVGTWIVTGSEQRGKPIDDFVRGDRLVITKDDFSMNVQKGEAARLFRRGLTTGKLIVNSVPRPRQLDFVDKNRTLLAVYALEENSLRICIGDPDSGERPTDFSSRPDDRQLLLILRRQ